MVVGLSARSLTMAGPSAVASSSSADLPSAAPTAGRVPRWYTPRRLLALFCAMELLVYGDRGVIASTGVQGDRELGTGIRGDLRLSGAQDGLLSSAFIVGLLLGCPAFAEAAKYANPFRCIAAGLAAWVAALLGCAGATSFTQLLLLRCCAGLGEASFVALASPFIDDASPRGAKTKWLACFLACIPTGYAFGIVFGQVAGGVNAQRWRLPFVLNALLMCPFVTFCALSAPLTLHGGGGGASDAARLPTAPAAAAAGAQAATAAALAPASSGSPPPLPPSPPPRPSATAPVGAAHPSMPPPGGSEALRSFLADASELASRPLLLLLTAAWALHTAMVGCLQYYGPTAARDMFSLPRADIVFGLETVFTGIVGTLAGGALLDRRGASVAVAFRQIGAACAASCALLAAAFMAPSLGPFIAVFGAGCLCLFSVNAVLTAAVLWSVPSRLRPLAMSATTVAIHVFGDVPAAPVVGYLHDRLGGDAAAWRAALALATLSLAAAAAVCVAGAAAAARRSDGGGGPVAAAQPAAADGAAGGGGGAAAPGEEESDFLLPAASGGV